MIETSEPSDLMNFVLNSVLPIYNPNPEQVIEYVFIQAPGRDKSISEAVRGFNPDTHVIITNEEFDVTNQLKALAGAVNNIERIARTVTAIHSNQEDSNKQVNEIHAVQTGNVFKTVKKEKPLTAAQKKKQAEAEKKADIQRRLNIANQRSLSRL